MQKQTQKSRLKEESEHAFHGEGMPDHSAGKTGKMRPVRTELKFHGDASHYTQDKVDSEDPCPEACGIVIDRIWAAQGEGFEDHDQRRDPHGQLGKQVVKGNSKGEVQAMNQQRTVDADPRFT